MKIADELNFPLIVIPVSGFFKAGYPDKDMISTGSHTSQEKLKD